jgi:hypothetical protein
MVIQSHQDLAHLENLDRACWAVTSAPIEDLHLDPVLAEFLSRDSAGRLRASHLIEARDWLFERLLGREGVNEGREILELRDLREDGEVGPELRQIAEEVLALLGAGGEPSLSLEDLRQYRSLFAKTLANGDGVVVPSGIPDDEVEAFAAVVLATVGSQQDGSGEPGVGHAEVTTFVEGAEQFLVWRSRPEKEPAIRPWGGQTAAAYASFARLREKIEGFFLRCDVLALEGVEAGPPRQEESWNKLWGGEEEALQEHLEQAPLAPPVRSGQLSLQAPVNPAYQGAYQEFCELVVSRILGAGAEYLDRASWDKICQTMKAHGDWKASRPPFPFEEVPEELLEEGRRRDLASRLEDFLEEDRAATGKLRLLEELERVILLQAWILELARNLVSFAAVYDLESPALFQMGTLIVDGRRLRLTVRVRDRASHRKVATLSKIFLVYAEILDAQGKVVFEIAAPVTAGERGRLRVGKRGVFLDREDREWDARIVAVVESPISIREAVMAPFRRFGTFVAGRFEALASSRLAGAEKQITEAASKVQVGALVHGSKVPGPRVTRAGAPRSSLQNMMLMGSLATAALGSAAAFFMKVVAETNPLHFLGSFLGIVLFVGLTSGFLGWIRLRKRDMSLLLEANHWAINVPMSVSRSLGATFTVEPTLPGEGARRLRKRLLLVVVVLLALGFLWDEGRLRLARWLQGHQQALVTAPVTASNSSSSEEVLP